MYAIALALAIPTIVAAQDMKGMDMRRSDQSPSKDRTVHKATGIVKKVDANLDTAIVAHDPVKSMNWPAMTMTFQVKDKPTLDKLGFGKKWNSDLSNGARNTSSRMPSEPA
jgi:Cu(I)/Ag(I) efflux system periplasmic protein CusF